MTTNGLLRKVVSMSKEKEFILYGLDDFNRIHIEAANFLGEAVDCFDLHLILSEALSNAFVHGNQKDASKPIFLRLKLENNLIKFEIEDTGVNPAKFEISEECLEENILNDHGRGLVLLRCFSYAIDFKDNTLFVAKKRKSQPAD